MHSTVALCTVTSLRCEAGRTLEGLSVDLLFSKFAQSQNPISTFRITALVSAR